MNDIKKLAVEIEARDDAIRFEVDQENIILANLGQSLQDAGITGDETVIGITDEIRRLEDSLRLILDGEEKRDTIHEELKTLKVELRNMKNREYQLLEELGRASWDLWKSGRQVDPDMEAALDDLIKAEERLNAAEDALYRNEIEQTGKAARILSKGKALLLTGRKKTASAALDRLWGRAGSRIREMVEPEKLQDTPAGSASAILKDLDIRRLEIDERESALSRESDKLDADLDKMPGRGTARKRISWIEETLETRRSDLDYAFRDLGREWLDGNNGKSADADVEKCRKDWIGVNKRISELDKERKTFQAHVAYLESVSEKDNKTRQIEKLDKEVKIRQAELKNLKKELTSIDRKLSTQKDSLPALPVPDES